MAERASERYTSAATGTTAPRTRPNCGDSQPGWFGSFHSDQRFTWGNCSPTARTNSPNMPGRGRQVWRLTIDPLQREAQAGPEPVTVSSTDIPRTSAPAIRSVSTSQLPGG